MKFKKSLELRKIGNENVILPLDSAEVNMECIVSLNESALLVYNSFRDKEFSVSGIRDLLFSVYDVSLETADKDSEDISEAFFKAGLVTD